MTTNEHLQRFKEPIFATKQADYADSIARLFSGGGARGRGGLIGGVAGALAGAAGGHKALQGLAGRLGGKAGPVGSFVTDTIPGHLITRGLGALGGGLAGALGGGAVANTARQQAIAGKIRQVAPWALGAAVGVPLLSRMWSSGDDRR